MDNVLRLTMKASEELKPTSKHKRETLAYAFEQIIPILRKYMKANHILALELNLKTKHVLAFEPIHNGEKEAWLDLWLRGEISTRQLRKHMKQRFQWVQYFSFSYFLEGVESWLKEN